MKTRDWTEKEVWNVIAESGVRGLHAKVNEALAAARRTCSQCGCEMEEDRCEVEVLRPHQEA
jgi:hypothetical protein